MWQRISTVRLFIEHVYPFQADPEDVDTILKLWKVINKRITHTHHKKYTKGEWSQGKLSQQFFFGQQTQRLFFGSCNVCKDEL